MIPSGLNGSRATNMAILVTFAKRANDLSSSRPALDADASKRAASSIPAITGPRCSSIILIGSEKLRSILPPWQAKLSRRRSAAARAQC